MSFRPHHIATSSEPIRNKKKWNSEKQNYFLLHMSFRPHHIAKSSERIRNEKKKWGPEKQNYSSLHMSFRPHRIAKSSKRIRNKKKMELRKAKLFLTSYVFSTTPHCQEFETDPKQKKMELRKAKLFLTSYVFSTTPHCQEFGTDPKQKKWNSEKQNYSSLHMSFRQHHIAKSSKRIQKKKNGTQKTKTIPYFICLFDHTTLPRV